MEKDLSGGPHEGRLRSPPYLLETNSVAFWAGESATNKKSLITSIAGVRHLRGLATSGDGLYH